MNGPERRRFVRYEVRASVELRAAGQVHRCESEDLGAGGCRIALPVRLERGTPVRLRLVAPQGHAVAEGEGEVVWVGNELPCRIGVQFSDELAEQVVPFMRALLGPVPLTTAGAAPPGPTRPPAAPAARRPDR